MFLILWFYVYFFVLFLYMLYCFVSESVLWKHLLNKPMTSSTDGEPQPVKSTTAVKQSQPESKKFTAESEAESKISAAAVMESKREPERSTDVKESLPEPERYTTPTKEPQTHVNPHWLPCGLGLGSLLYLTHMCFGEASLVSRWTVKSFPNTGPNPLMWG